MSSRSTRRALRHSGASLALMEEINRLRAHNAALSLFLRGAIRSHGGLVDPRLVIAKPYLEGPRDAIEAMPFEDRVVLTLVPDPAAAGRDELDEVPWGLDSVPAPA